MNTRVVDVSDGGVELSDRTMIRGKTLIWTAGTSLHPLMQALPCVKQRGRLTTNERLELPGWPGVWAVGDGAAVPDPKTGKDVHLRPSTRFVRERWPLTISVQRFGAATRRGSLSPLSGN
jgi:NADH dehydrogenase